MKREVEKVWKDGKLKNKQKIATLISRYAPDEECDCSRDIAYSNSILENGDETEAEIDVNQYGGVVLCDDDKAALRINPKYMAYPRIDEIEAEVEIKKGCTKASYHFMNNDDNVDANSVQNPKRNFKRITLKKMAVAHIRMYSELSVGVAIHYLCVWRYYL